MTVKEGKSQGARKAVVSGVVASAEAEQNLVAQAPKRPSKRAPAGARAAGRSLAEREKARNAQKEKFLEAMSAGLSPLAGAKLAGVHFVTPYRWRAADPDFAQAWEEAFRAGTHVFEDEARRRGVQGVQRPVFQAGKLVGHVTEYSDNLLLRHLERRDGTWRQAKVHLEVPNASSGAAQVDAVRARVLGKLAALSGSKIIDGTAE